MAYQLQEINRRIQSDVTEFLAECDENYAQRVSLAADKILSNLEASPIVRSIRLRQDHHRHENRGGAPAAGGEHPCGGHGQLL